MVPKSPNNINMQNKNKLDAMTGGIINDIPVSHFKMPMVIRRRSKPRPDAYSYLNQCSLHALVIS